jgi:PadR family transcriptional regulator PadR
MGRGIGQFEHLLLIAVLRLGPDGAYGAGIRTELEAKTGRTVSPGAIYTALDRLESRGLVASWLGDATPQRGGKRKRHYRLEPAGLVEVRAAQEAFARMSRGLKPKLGTS